MNSNVPTYLLPRFDYYTLSVSTYFHPLTCRFPRLGLKKNYYTFHHASESHWLFLSFFPSFSLSINSFQQIRQEERKVLTACFYLPPWKISKSSNSQEILSCLGKFFDEWSFFSCKFKTSCFNLRSASLIVKKKWDSNRGYFEFLYRSSTDEIILSVGIVFNIFIYLHRADYYLLYSK